MRLPEIEKVQAGEVSNEEEVYGSNTGGGKREPDEKPEGKAVYAIERKEIGRAHV